MPKLLTTEEAAKMLRIHKGTLQRYIKEGRIRAYDIGQGHKIREEDLVAYMEKQQVQSDKTEDARI